MLKVLGSGADWPVGKRVDSVPALLYRVDKAMMRGD